MLRRAILGSTLTLPPGAAVLFVEGVLAVLAGAYLGIRGGVPAGLALLVICVPAAAAVVAIATSLSEHRTAFALLADVLPLNLLGLVVLCLVAPSFAWRQALWSALGLALYFAVALRAPRLTRLRRWAPRLCLASLLLLATTFVFGTHPSGPGAKQWLPLGPIYFEPSEAVKITVLMLLAALLGEREWAAPMARWWAALPAAAVMLLLAQGDMGAALVVAMVAALMLIGARGRKEWVIAAIVIAAAAGFVAYRYVPHAQQRLGTWLDLWEDPYGASYQIVQALRAVAGAGLPGKGLLATDTLYVPASHTDMVLPAISERLGLAGSASVLLFFVSLLAGTRAIGAAATSTTDAMLALGAAALLIGQAFVIVAGSTAMLPLTGVTLPFVSYGGSSLVVSYALLGLIEGRRRAVGAPQGARSPRRWHQAVYLGLAGALMAAGVWLFIWHAYGAAILGTRLTAL